MSDILETETLFGSCSICHELLKEKEMSEGVCESCLDDYEEEKEL